jgi:hypothetical protein
MRSVQERRHHAAIGGARDAGQAERFPDEARHFEDHLSARPSPALPRRRAGRMAVAFRKRHGVTHVQREDLDIRAHSGQQIGRGLDEHNGCANVVEIVHEVHQRSLGAAHAEIVDEEQRARGG